MKKMLCTVLAVLMLLTGFSAFAEEAGEASTWESFRGKRIGVQVGTTSGAQASAVIPDITLSYYNSQTDVLAALRAHKIDAWATDETIPKFMMMENPDLTLVDGYLDTIELAALFAKTPRGQELRDQYSEFVDGLRADGTLAQLDEIWFGPDDSKRVMMDYETLPSTNGTLRMALDPAVLPFAYMKENRVVGYDVDLAARFCEACGYGLSVETMDVSGILAAVQSGKADFSACGITITEERKESVLFSTPTYSTGAVLAVLKTETEGLPTLSQLADKRIGVQTGTTFDEIVKESFPDARVSYFNSVPDMVAALKANKIDAIPGDEPVLRLMMAEDHELTILDEYLDNFTYGFVLPKTEEGEKLQGEMNAWLAEIKESGELEEVISEWVGAAEEDKILPDYAAYPAPKGTLTLATEGAYAPMNYYRGNEVVGFEIELAARFCEANGYGLRVQTMLFDGILPAVETGKADFAASGITITEERKESVYFSDPYYVGGTAVLVLRGEKASGAGKSERADGSAAPGQQETFWEGLRSSFQKTFLREDRWQLFLEGVGNTMLITVLSILFGTALGFGTFLLCRNGNAAANGTTRFTMWLVQGTPMVVLLMILYYIIFGSVAISGIAVAVIGFTLTFGSAVFGLIRMGVGMVDRGQYEAAYALGHTSRHTFFRIILPQAVPHVLPAYQGEIVGLIKSTAIVGYIAVQDLTKMGDIVRSRTYEAFFPLIAITVIYFVLEGLFSFAVSRIRVSIDPRKRDRSRILKGVKTHD